MPEQKGRGWRIFGGLVLTVVILATAGAAVYFALDDHTNRQSAREWRARALALRHGLDRRTFLLSQRTHALTVATGQVSALGGQVGSLDERTRQLASEKAQVEDEKAYLENRSQALQTVVQSMTDCATALQDAIPHIAAADATWFNSHVDALNRTCDEAQRRSDTFAAKYGTQ